MKHAADEVGMITELTAFWLKKLSADEVKFIYEIEVPMAEVLAEMEFNGVSVNVEYLQQLSRTMDNQLHRLERKNLRSCGLRFQYKFTKASWRNPL